MLALPANVASLFSTTDAAASPSGGPCLVEPEPGTLFPNNWVRPRFRWVPNGGENLFELRIKAAPETNNLVVYTTATEWMMPATMWAALTLDIQDVPMTVSIRGAVLTTTGALQSPPELGFDGETSPSHPLTPPGLSSTGKSYRLSPTAHPPRRVS